VCMSRRLLAFQTIVMFIGLGVFAAFFLAAVVAQGGRVTLNMTLFNEMWPEYWAMFVGVGVLPWALWYVDRRRR